MNIRQQIEDVMNELEEHNQMLFDYWVNELDYKEWTEEILEEIMYDLSYTKNQNSIS